MSNTNDLRQEEVLNNRDALNRYGFDSDLARDKAILNIAFGIFIGLLAFFNTIRVSVPAIICGILALLFSLVTIFLSFKVLKQNSDLASNCLSEQKTPNDSFMKLLKIIADLNKRDGLWAYRALWATILCVVLCVLFYSGITIGFKVEQPNSEMVQEYINK